MFTYDNFDDYIEVLFQFVYIILFASVFPLAAPLALLFNFVEIYSDKYKLVKKLYQRSAPKKV